MNASQFFVLKLLPPRPGFAQDMTADEKFIMQKHVAYWTDLLQQGFVVVFGPVMDPAGVYGLGVVQVSDEEQVKTFIKNDPATGLNTYEYQPMRAVIPGTAHK